MDGGIFCEFSSQYQWCSQDEQVIWAQHVHIQCTCSTHRLGTFILRITVTVVTTVQLQSTLFHLWVLILGNMV